MILPRYMICSEGRIVDRETGLVSHINVTDRLVVARGQGHPRQVSSGLRFFVSAAWATDEETPSEDQYEWEMSASFPGEKEPRAVGSGEIRFTHPFYRIDVLFQLILGDPLQAQVKMQTGIIRFTSRIRRKGDTDWLSQEYPVRLDVAPEPQTNESVSEKVQSGQ